MFELSPRVKDLKQQIEAFMDEHIYPTADRFTAEIETGEDRLDDVQQPGAAR